MSDNKRKKNIASSLLEKGSLFVYLNPRDNDNVFVPPWFKYQDMLVLQFGHNMPIPIDDLELTDECIIGTLSFSRTPFRCEVPWSAVFALVDDTSRGMVWEEQVPESIKQERLDFASSTSLIPVKPVSTQLTVPRQEPIYERYGKQSDASSTPVHRKKTKIPPYLRVVK